MTELSVSRLVSVELAMSPQGASARDFGSLLILGDSENIYGNGWLRKYDTLSDVVKDFGSREPEYQGAALVFGQLPAPKSLMIGRWFRQGSHGALLGGTLSAAEQAIAEWRKINKGAFKIYIDGASGGVIVKDIDLSSTTNLNGVASAISAKTSGATIIWDAVYKRFRFTSATRGKSSSIAPLENANQSGNTELAALLKMDQNTMSDDVAGQDAETAPAAANRFMASSGDWYGLTFCAGTMPSDSELVSVGQAINSVPSDQKSRVLGVTTTAEDALNPTNNNDLASLMASEAYRRVAVQYSKNKFAVCSFLARAFAVDFRQNASTITMMYKREPEVTPEGLTTTQANTLKKKYCNVYVKYDNKTSIIEYGVTSDGSFFDEVQGVDWLINTIQTDMYNLLYLSETKIPQTEGGLTEIQGTIAGSMNKGVNNGLVAPGRWNAAGFGALKRGDYLPTGYYIYIGPIAQQPEAERAKRFVPPIQIGAKLAGAMHEADIKIVVNR